MKSPFPGMDPYLEWYWGDVHTRLTTYASNQLAAQLPSDLRVRIEKARYFAERLEVVEHLLADAGTLDLERYLAAVA